VARFCQAPYGTASLDARVCWICLLLCAGTVSILPAGRDRMSPLAAVSLGVGLSLSAGVTQPASTLPPFLLHLEEEEQTSKQRPGKPAQNPRCTKMRVSRSSPVSPAHLCPACVFKCGCFFLSSCISFLIFPETEVCVSTTRKPRIGETVEPHFRIPASHGEDQVFTEEHPTHALPSTPAGNTHPCRAC